MDTIEKSCSNENIESPLPELLNERVGLTMLLKKSAGFTVIELLVFIAIIALLSAILIPVFSKMHFQTERSSCINNLREIGVALGQYHDDYGKYPAQPTGKYLNPTAMSKFDQTQMPFDILPAGVGDVRPGTTDVGRMRVTSTATQPGHYIVKVSTDSVTSSVTNVMTSPDNGSTWSGEMPMYNYTTATITAADMLTVPIDSQGKVNATFAPPPPNYVGENSGANLNYDRWNFVTGVDTVGMDNYGLETMYRLYLNDKKDFLRSANKLHCPSARDTERLDQMTLWNKLTPIEAKGFRYDPLLGGYNTYDVTYNYNQYNQKILDFETALGPAAAGLYIKRQLSNLHPPADTVVCFCFAHRTFGTLPDILPKFGEMDLVLWLDGSVEVMKPYNVVGASGEVQVPTCLYSRGAGIK